MPACSVMSLKWIGAVPRSGACLPAAKLPFVVGGWRRQPERMRLAAIHASLPVAVVTFTLSAPAGRSRGPFRPPVAGPRHGAAQPHASSLVLRPVRPDGRADLAGEDPATQQLR